MDTSSAFVLIVDLFEAIKTFISSTGSGALGLLSSAPVAEVPAAE